MAKSGQRRAKRGTSASQAAAPAPPRPMSGQRLRPSRRRAARRAEPRHRAELIAIGLAVLLAVGLAGWWAVASLGDDSGDGGGANVPAGAIARIEAPDIHSLLIDPRDPDHVLFGSHAGIQESRDGGFSWEDGTLENTDAMRMATSAQDPSTLYVAGHDVFLVSRDGGQTWQSPVHDLPGTDIHAFAQDPDDPRRLVAFVVGAGVLGSTDGGATWAPLAAQPPGDAPLDLAAGGGKLYAATGDGIVVSLDGGASWQPLPAQPAGGAASVTASAADPLVLYAGTPSGLSKSSDGGTTWTAVGPPGTAPVALAVAPTDPNRVLFVDRGGAVYRSDDAGATWRTRS